MTIRTAYITLDGKDYSVQFDTQNNPLTVDCCSANNYSGQRMVWTNRKNLPTNTYGITWRAIHAAKLKLGIAKVITTEKTPAP